MKIQVTQKHIDNGAVLVPDSCPVALALQDAGYTGVEVYHTALYANSREDGLLQEFQYPYIVRDFVQAFDSSRHATCVKPFTFIMRRKAR